MRLDYYPESDWLHIDLTDKPRIESRKISDGVFLDFDAQGELVGIDIDQASAKVNLGQLAVSRLPSVVVPAQH